MSLITITHSQKLSPGEHPGKAQRTDAWWNVGRRPGIPVAGVAPEAEQNRARGKNSYNNPDENKSVGLLFYPSHSQNNNKSRQRQGLFFQQNCSVKTCNELHSPKNSVQVNIVYLDSQDGDPSLCPPDVASLIIDSSMAFLQHFHSIQRAL